MVGVPRSTTIKYNSGAFLRHRLLLSTLSSRAVRFQNIRSDTQTPGLSPSEISFIRLLDKLTSGTTIHINETGTSLFYKPGLLLGGSLSHDCHPSRPVTYYLQPLLLLAPFCKQPLSISLRGPTHGPSDPSADTLMSVSIPLLRRLTLGSGLDAKIEVRRRALVGESEKARSGGMVTFSCGVLSRKIAPIDLTEAGFVKRVRGVAMSNRTSTMVVGRMVDAVRGGLNKFLPDVYVHTDVANGKDCGQGFGLALVGESTEGCLVAADWCVYRGGVGGEVVGTQVVNMLLEEISGGGCVDTGHLWMAVVACAVAEEEISRIRVGKLSEANVEILRDVERFLGVLFRVKVVEDDDDDDDDDNEQHMLEGRFGCIGRGTILSCVGVGLENTARQRF
eukprot:GFKZ01011429.1.p1 GENE.GFKZ01011429.1~~GFKZ01011429.1.p1  ORF type:complete len:392 (+),score=58.74 GFKZ01011429.1:117-1292(+)